jgi:hypothetical protein
MKRKKREQRIIAILRINIWKRKRKAVKFKEEQRLTRIQGISLLE